MASDQSWNLKGLKPELRETAREAARRKGISVNEWLQSVILESAAEDPPAAPEVPPPPRTRRPGQQAPQTESQSAATHEGMRAISSRLTELTQQLDRLSRTRAEAQSAPARPDTAIAPGAELSSTLRAIETRLAALGAAAIPSPQVPAAQLNDALARLDRRLETLTQEGRATSTELERRIAAVDQALTVLNRAPSDTQTAPSPQAPPAARDPAREAATRFGLDRAMAEIAERQRALDADEEPGGLRQQFSALSQRLDAGAPRQPTTVAETTAAEPAAAGAAGLQEEMRQLTEELRTLRRPGGFEHAIDALRGELTEIGRKLTEAAPRRAVQAIETEVRALADRVDHGRQRGVDATALAGIERSLALVHDALHQLAPAESLAEVREEVRALDRRIESVAANASDAADNARMLQLLTRSVAELREIAAHAASGEALITLAEEVQALGDKVDRLAAPTFASLEPELSSILEQRFQALSDHLDARAQANGTAATGQLAAVVEHIATKLDRVELGGDNSPMLDAIARQITRLTEHVEQSDARFEAFEHLSASMRDLLDGMEQMRTSTVLAAERAAKETALEVARQSAAPPIEVDALRSDLEALRQGQVQSDRRTQDTLEAVHDTLERLVDRLAVVETDLRSPPQNHAAPALQSLQPYHAPALAPAQAPVLRSAPPPPEPAWRAPAAVMAETPAIGLSPQDRRPIDPTLPADHPLEPGTAAARGRAPVTAAERIAASEAALGPAKPVTETDAKSNFIAAARRAAQAAANMSPPAEAQAGSDKRASSTFGALAQKFTGRRSLALGLILVIGLGALHLLLNNIGLRETAEPALGPITATVAPASRPAGSAALQPAPAAPTSATNAAAMQPAPRPERTPEAGVSAAPAESNSPAPRADATVLPGVSPLTIATIQNPTGDITNSVGRSTSLTAKPAGATAATPAVPAAPGSGATELPGAVSKGLRTAALAGNPAAEYELATRYAEGRGVALNFEEAARWFERAANRDLAPAQYRLGSLYEKGQGVKKDLDQARRLYRAASDKGNAKAMHNLAVLYAEGIDGKPDFSNAAEWFRKAAARGVADSQYNLGILYARGLGVEQNLAESYKWFALAAQGGDVDAGKKRDDVGARLDQQALIAARLATQTFTPEPQPEEAVTVKAPAGGWDAATPAPAAKPKGAPGAPRKIKSS